MEIGFAGRMLAGMAVIVAVLFALQFVACSGWRSRLGGGDRRLMSIVDTLALPGATSLHVVKIVDRYYVFGRTGTHVADLREIPAESVESWIAAHRPPTNADSPLAALSMNFRWPHV